jgi:hypothetical protein
LRHNRIGILAIYPTLIIADSNSTNKGLGGTITDLGDGVIGTLREEGYAGGALSRMIPETTLNFLGRNSDVFHAS